MGADERLYTANDVSVRHDLRPGDVGRVTLLHGLLYAAEYGWDHTFEAYVAGPLAAFALRQNPRERIWIVEHEGDVAGCVGIVEADAETAQLRWYLLHPRLRGRGLGRALLADAIDFCRLAGYRRVFLWTVSALGAAAALYREAGFALTEETTHPLWGVVVCEQRYDLHLDERKRGRG
jgi:N-acetylglutamate synthase-like GNAT family acetyltransferase